MKNFELRQQVEGLQKKFQELTHRFIKQNKELEDLKTEKHVNSLQAETKTKTVKINKVTQEKSHVNAVKRNEQVRELGNATKVGTGVKRKIPSLTTHDTKNRREEPGEGIKCKKFKLKEKSANIENIQKQVISSHDKITVEDFAKLQKDLETTISQLRESQEQLSQRNEELCELKNEHGKCSAQKLKLANLRIKLKHVKCQLKNVNETITRKEEELRQSLSTIYHKSVKENENEARIESLENELKDWKENSGTQDLLIDHQTRCIAELEVALNAEKEKHLEDNKNFQEKCDEHAIHVSELVKLASERKEIILGLQEAAKDNENVKTKIEEAHGEAMNFVQRQIQTFEGERAQVIKFVEGLKACSRFPDNENTSGDFTNLEKLEAHIGKKLVTLRKLCELLEKVVAAKKSNNTTELKPPEDISGMKTFVSPLDFVATKSSIPTSSSQTLNSTINHATCTTSPLSSSLTSATSPTVQSPPPSLSDRTANFPPSSSSTIHASSLEQNFIDQLIGFPISLNPYPSATKEAQQGVDPAFKPIMTMKKKQQKQQGAWIWVGEEMELASSSATHHSELLGIQEKQFKCHACPRRFIAFGHLKRHEQEVHELREALKHFVGGCRFCGRFFNTQGEKKQHLCSEKNLYFTGKRFDTTDKEDVFMGTLSQQNSILPPPSGHFAGDSNEQDEIEIIDLTGSPKSILSQDLNKYDDRRPPNSEQTPHFLNNAGQTNVWICNETGGFQPHGIDPSQHY